jgi:hydroxymethylpyrimidine pyrophosphatase-like HAD family hydrolase
MWRRWSATPCSDRTTAEERQIAAALPAPLRPAALMAIQRYVHWQRPGGYAPDPAWNRRADAIHAAVWTRISPHFPTWLSAIHARFDVVRVVNDGTFFAVEVAKTDILQLHAFVSELVADAPDATVFSNRSMSAVEPAQFDKGWVLAHVATRLGIGRADVLAVGDYLNDLGMLDGRVAGTTGCPGDACDEVQALVRSGGGIVADAGAADGTASIIRTWLTARGSA